MTLRRLLAFPLTLGLLVGAFLAPGTAHAAISYGKSVPALAVGQSWVYDATAEQADIISLQLVFMFSSSVGNTFRITTMPYDMTKVEDDTVYRQIGNNTIIDDDDGQNAYSDALWTRTNASNATGDITNYGFNIMGFSTNLKNLRVVVTRLK